MASTERHKPVIVILGAGVSGLTTALLLARKQSYNITILAKHMPGDYDINYVRVLLCLRGCHMVLIKPGFAMGGSQLRPVDASCRTYRMNTLTHSSVSLSGTTAAEWDRQTWKVLSEMARDTPDAGVHFQENLVYVRNRDRDTPVGDWLQEMMKPEGPWLQTELPNYKILDKSSCLEGYEAGFRYSAVCINTALYLPWLASQCLRLGVTFRRASFKHINEAFGNGPNGRSVNLVVNCCGLGASTLGGVMDPNMVAVRGQTVLVRNEADGAMVECSGMGDSPPDELVYVMQRAAGGGTILGGCYQKHNTDPNPDPTLTERILQRAAVACPALTGGRGPEALDVVGVRVGLRPLREGGTRVETERLAGDRTVVHNYGHGGFGFQCSWGCSMDVVGLVEQALRGSPPVKARL